MTPAVLDAIHTLQMRDNDAGFDQEVDAVTRIKLNAPVRDRPVACFSKQTEVLP